MEVPLDEAGDRLDELVGRAQAGEVVILTRDGHPVARLLPITAQTAESEFLDWIGAVGHAKATPGPTADRSQDFLYGDNGMP